MKRLGAMILGAALIGGCSQGSEEPKDLKTFDVEEAGAPPPSSRMESVAADSAAGPGIGVTAAPGVAFNYRYAFRLPNAKIASVQEEHAQLCEKLGINRCRITGMRYRLVDEDEISAMLAFKLDPVIARQFGKDGIGSVTRAEGMLVDSEITGVDAGADIQSATRNIAQLQDDLTRIERRLSERGVSNEERARLTDEATQLRAQIRANRDSRAASNESLATTPMVFHYGSGSVIPGFDGASPLSDAFKTAIGAFMTMLSFVIIAIGVILPWALLAAAVIWLWRRFGWRWPQPQPMAQPAPRQPPATVAGAPPA